MTTSSKLNKPIVALVVIAMFASVFLGYVEGVGVWRGWQCTGRINNECVQYSRIEKKTK